MFPSQCLDMLRWSFDLTTRSPEELTEASVTRQYSPHQNAHSTHSLPVEPAADPVSHITTLNIYSGLNVTRRYRSPSGSESSSNTKDLSEMSGTPPSPSEKSDRCLTQVDTNQPLVSSQRSPTSSGEDFTALPDTRGRANSTRELREVDAPTVLGYAFSKKKKWSILVVVFIVQISMNFNAAVFANALPLLQESWGVTKVMARIAQMVFLVAYAFGCELWAPWSEELGRKSVLQTSLFLVNIWAILGARAPNFATVVVARGLGGLCSAGGSITLGIVADMWRVDKQQYAVAWVVLASVAGSVVGPVVGGFLQENLDWRWNFYIQIIFGVAVQFAHLVFVPETRAKVLLDKEVKRLRKSGDEKYKNICGPSDMPRNHLTPRKVVTIWIRPFVMFVKEPIVLCLSLLSGFSDALIFTFLESYGIVFNQYGFGPVQTGLTFIPLIIGYILAWLFYCGMIRYHSNIKRQRGKNALTPESRLYLLLYLAPLEVIGMFGFAWTSRPEFAPWIAPLIFSIMVGIANYAIYMATIDYMVAAYGAYAASATGGNGFARDLLAGVSALYAAPLYENLPGKYHIQWGSTLMACLAILVIIPIYIFYLKGEWFRERSHFAKDLERERVEREAEEENCEVPRIAVSPA